MTSRVILTRGARIACVDEGVGEFAFVFLHYWGGSARTWRKVLDELSPSARCVAVDQRGWGASEALDGRYGLETMADDVEHLVGALGLKRYVLVGHSMGGKVALILASRGVSELAGLVLVAPAPPGPMSAPPEQRAAMMASYQSPDGVAQAISVLAGRPLSEAERRQVVEDTLAGAPGAKREWTEHGMVASVAPKLRDFKGPVSILVGERDKVERPEALRAAFADVLPQATFQIIASVGHLSPIESPGTIALACRQLKAMMK